MSESREWVGWVGPARKGDAAAAEKLTQYFAPFVHAILLARLSHLRAGALVKEVLAQAIFQLGGLSQDAGFGSWLMMAARERAFDAAKVPGATVDQPGNDSLVNDGHRVLGKLRALAEASRERLLMRLLEGIPGFEIAEATGAKEAEVRSELERAASTLVQQLTAQSVAFANDSYLWSLVGIPHPALIPLENQLTALRYTATERDAPTGAPPRPAGNVPERPRRTGTLPKAETTDPSGAELPVLGGGDEQELQTAAQRIPVSRAELSTAKGLPVPAANPFGASVKTIHVSDLPAAADFADLQPTRPEAKEPFGTLVEADDDEDPATLVQQLPPAAVRARPKPEPGTAAAPAPAPAPAQESIPTQTRASGSTAKGKSLPAPVDHSAEEQVTSLRPLRPSQPGAWRASGLVGNPAPMKTVMGLPAVIVARGSVTRSWRPFAIAGVFTVIAAGVALLLFDGTDRRVRAGWTLIPVVVAATDLTEGTQITIEMVSQRSVPEHFVTSSAIKPDSTQYVVNQKILVSVQAGDPLLWSQFEVSRGSERLSSKVMRRARAYDLMTSKAIAVGGWVQPNDHIDIIASLNASERGARVAITLLQNVPVLSTGKITSSTSNAAKKHGDKDYIDISVLLLPEEAELVALAVEVGELQFTLRTEQDHETVSDHRGTSSKTLLQGERVRLLQLKRFKTIQSIRKQPP